MAHALACPRRPRSPPTAPDAPSAAKTPQLEPFPLGDVRLLDGPFLAMQKRGLDYLLSLDPDRLLHTFRLNAGLETSAAPYGGWEGPKVELRGHSLGHYLTACALAWEATGDERLKARALAITAELRRVQLALAAKGATPGYLSAFPESSSTASKRARTSGRLHAPQDLAGLLDVHRVFGGPGARSREEWRPGWACAPASDGSAWQEMLQTEFGGMEVPHRALSVTRDQASAAGATLRPPCRLRPARAWRDALDTCARTRSQASVRSSTARRPANTLLPRGETFWNRVALARTRSAPTAGTSFFTVLRFSRHLGATARPAYNMLKLTRALFLRDARPGRIDFYERGLFNHILASNDPETGRVTYFVSMKPGAWRTYSTAEDSFWCCVGTGMENPSRFGEAVYARAPGSLYVNLFLASELHWREQGLTLRQLTRFPEEEKTRLELRLDAPRRSRSGCGGVVSGWRLCGERERRPQTPTAAPGAYRASSASGAAATSSTRAADATPRAMPDDASVVAFLKGRSCSRPTSATPGSTRRNATAPEGPRAARGRAQPSDARGGGGGRAVAQLRERRAADVPKAWAGRATWCCGRSTASTRGGAPSTCASAGGALRPGRRASSRPLRSSVH